MKGHWLGKVVKCLVLGTIAVIVAGFAVQGLWNWLTPALFGWPAIGFGQAIGLLILSKILFGGFRGGRCGGGHWRQRMIERWEHMTPEEREKFREGLKGCGA